jgi:hypothetical protein
MRSVSFIIFNMYVEHYSSVYSEVEAQVLISNGLVCLVVSDCSVLTSVQWQCPICLKNYSLENLRVDPYFNRITSLVGLPCTFTPVVLYFIASVDIFLCDAVARLQRRCQ